MVEELIELIAPGGCDEANHGTERYRVDNNGRVRVPREAAFYLIRYGGFRPAPAEPQQAPQGAFLTPAAGRKAPRSTDT